MAKLLTIEEVAQSKGNPVWFESRNGKLYEGWVLVYDVHTDGIVPGYRIGLTQPGGHNMWLLARMYNRKWRCWNTYPTVEETEATLWET